MQLLERLTANRGPAAPYPTTPAPTAAIAPATASDPVAQEPSKLPAAAEGGSQAALTLPPQVDAATSLELLAQELPVAGFRQQLAERQEEIKQQGEGSVAAAVPGVTAAGRQATEAAGNGIQRMAPTV